MNDLPLWASDPDAELAQAHCAAAAPVGLAGDSLKDLDCAGFRDAFEPAESRLWLDWMRALRIADGLAESGSGGFGHFRALAEATTMLRLVPDTPRARAWSSYLDALATYGAGYAVCTLAEHDVMLLRLSGPLLQLAPHMPEKLWEAAAAFGALDQAFNNLRDLQEDAARGMCWLPEDVLQRHGLSRADVITGRAPERPLWRTLMGLWCGSYLPSLRDAAAPFIEAEDLHPSLLAMRSWTLRRYERVMRVFEEVEGDYRRFPERYWAEVRRELAGRGVAE